MNIFKTFKKTVVGAKLLNVLRDPHKSFINYTFIKEALFCVITICKDKSVTCRINVHSTFDDDDDPIYIFYLFVLGRSLHCSSSFCECWQCWQPCSLTFNFCRLCNVLLSGID